MENKTLDLVKFLKTENIPFSNIWFYISDKTGKKKPIGEYNKITNIEDIKTKWYIEEKKPPKSYYLGKEEILLSKKERESLKFSVSIYLKASSENIYCLDIDDINITSIDDLINFNKKFEVFRGCPYLQGNTKGIHIYLKIDNLPINAKELKVVDGLDGDLIRKNNNMWERLDKKVLGGSKLINFEFEDIKNVFNSRIYGVIEKEKKEMVRIATADDFAKVNIQDAKTKSDANFQEINDDRLKVLNLIKTSRYDEYDDWYKMLWAFKSCGFTFQVFDEFSKLSKKYNKDNKNIDIWNSAKISKDLNFGFFHFLAKTDSPEEYNKLDFDFIEENERGEWIEYTDKYLLKQNQTLIYNETILENNINKWASDDNIKSFNIKSPYGTGKTQMIKAILNTFKFKKILWLVYRKSLCNDLLGEAGFKEFQFADYQKDSLKSDRLIIQIESARKLENNLMYFFEEVSEYPSYDLVIVDEIESVLNHFSSETFKNQSSDTFEFIKNVIFNSSKVLSLDGDFGNRAIDYIESFGASVNIKNNIKINLKKFIITEYYDYFIEQIENDIKENRKCVIVSMTATHCEEIKDYFNDNYPKLKILIYTGNSSDSDKKDLLNVKTIWSTCDLLLYSPCIESGVSYDQPYFYKIYGVIAESTTSRAFSQMLSRVRQTESDEILIYNTQFKNHRVLDHQFYKFEDVKQSILLLENIKLRQQTKIVNGKMCKVNQLTEYDNNYIYNKCEKLNSNKFYFLETFIKLMKSKGHTVIKLFDRPDDINDQVIKEYKINKIETILSAEDLSNGEYDTLIDKQKKDNATKEEKLSITKAYYKKSLGVDKVDDKFLKTFTPNAIYKFISLIDTKNISTSNDLQIKEEIDKAKQIRSLINDLGFNNIFDNKKIGKDDFEVVKENIIKNNILFSDFNNTKTRFNLNKTIKSVDGRAFNGFVNQLLNQYYIHLRADPTTINKKKGCYILEIKHDINELLQYKINKGFKLEDSEKIRPVATSTTYKDLLFTDEEKEIRYNSIESKIARGLKINEV